MIPEAVEAKMPAPKSIWLSFSNICDRGKFKVTLEINQEPFKVFEQYVYQDDGVVCESWSLTWLLSESQKENAKLREALAGCNCKSSRPVDAKERFLSFCEKTEGCWNWAGSKNGSGYGQMSIGNRPKSAHRISYELYKGKIAKGYQIDHVCRNRGCVNPEHLEAVSPRENVLRGVGSGSIHAKKTHCQKGHAYAGENLIVTLKGQRKCRACQSIYYHNRKARKALGREE